MTYVVVRDPRSSDRTQPTRVYSTRADAEQEAARLAGTMPGTFFFVCGILSSARLEKPKAVIVEIDKGGDNPFEDDIPF
jgi:hypothetical protein